MIKTFVIKQFKEYKRYYVALIFFTILMELVGIVQPFIFKQTIAQMKIGF